MNRRQSTRVLAAAMFAATVFGVSRADAGDTTKPVFDGVTLITRVKTNPNNVIHILVVDLTKPGVHLGSTTSAGRQARTSSFATSVSASAAINGDLFSYSTYATSGLAAGGHAKWPDTSDNKTAANIAFGDDSRVEIHDAAEVLAFDSTWMKGVVSGHPQLVKAGTAITTNPSSPACPTRNPRTAVGLSQDGLKLWMVVVDGRSTASAGMTCTELAAMMKGLGAYKAINLDGGGSTTMYIRGSGVVNKPSDGTERVVGNHLGLFAPKLGTIGTIEGVVYEEPDPTHVIEGASVTLAEATDQTDETGHYELDGIPGTATVTVKAPGYATATVDVTVAMGTTTTVSIGLTIDPTADFDGDGVPDVRDNCDQTENADQGDTDGDGIGDACDMDDDSDGLADEDDNCPFAANPDQADSDNDGVGDACIPDADLFGGCATTGDASLPVFVLALFGLVSLRRRRLAIRR